MADALRYIACGLAGTLARRESLKGPEHIGEPIQAMRARVLAWVANGIEVRVVTDSAGIAGRGAAIKAWLKNNGFPPLIVTNVMEPGMIEYWGTRCVRVIANVGQPQDGGLGE